MAKSKDTVTEPNKVDWAHKRPITKVEKKDVEAYAKDKGKATELYLKYFGLDNSNNSSEQIQKAMIRDLDKLLV